MSFVPSPTPMNTLLHAPPPAQLCTNFATLDSCRVVEPAAASTVRDGSSALYGRTDCSNDMPLMTPSDACGSNCTWWMCMLTFANPSNVFASVCSLVSVTASQSPMFERIASGCAGFVPAYTPALSCASVNRRPFGSVCVRVTLIGNVIATTLNLRVGAPFGQSESCRLAYGSTAVDVTGVRAALPMLLPSHGVPVWPLPENGGLNPMCGRISGHAGLPFNGSNMIFGLTPVG